MPFKEEEQPILGDRATRDFQSTREVSAGELIGASFKKDHTLVNLIDDFLDLNQDPVDPDYEAAEDPRLENYAGYTDDLIYATSENDFTRRIQKIDEERSVNETIAAASGTAGFASAALVAVTDPVSWIPIGGAAYKTYRTGGNILEGAAKTAGLAAIVETGREAYMQETQATRTLEESLSNIASATVLTGILGGAAGALSPVEREVIQKNIEQDMIIPTSSQNTGLSSVGSMQAGTTTEQEAVKGLSKTQALFRKIPDALKNPVYRGSTSASKLVRQYTERLADTSLIKNKNTDFIASATSVENKIKAYDALKYKFYQDFNPQWKAYRASVKKQKQEGGIPEAQRIGSKKDGSLTWEEFSSEITKANRRNDTHIVPEVQNAAISARKNVFDPMLNRMVETGLLDDMDIEIKTADSWARRMYDRDKILANYDDFKARNLEWLKKKNDNALQKLEDFKIRNADDIAKKNNKVLSELETLKARVINAERNADYLDGIADTLIDRIVGLPGGRLGYDVTLEPKSSGPQKVGARGSAKRRVYDIPDEMIEDYLINDVHAIIDSHIRTSAPDSELMDTFGGLDFDIIKQEVVEDYKQLLAKAKGNKKEISKLQKAKRKDISDLKHMWEKLRGIYAQPDDYAAPKHVAERGFLALNYARLLGGMTLSAIPDMGRHVMVHGMSRTMNDGVLAMMKDFEGWKYAVEDIREAAVGLDMATSATARARAGFDEYTPMTGKIDAISQGLASGFNIGNVRVPSFGSITLMNQWNAGQKTFAGVMTQTRMMRAIQDLGKGKEIAEKEIENLASHGIDAIMAKRIAKEFKNHGEARDKILVPNAREWTDTSAANTFRAAIRKQVDEIIVTPGLDRAVWMSEPGWRLIGQFRSFSFAAMQRVTMAGLQQGDASALSGVMSMIAMGAMVYAIKAKAAGYQTSDDPRVWLTEGIDRSGLTGWFFDVNNITEKATRGRVGINALIGGPPMSRYASRNVTASILGPTLGLSEDFFRLTGAAAAADWKESDTHAMRRLLPYQNVVYLRYLFDQLEEGANSALGISQ